MIVLPIRDARVETPRTRVIHLALGAARVEFAAGQFVSVGTPGSPLRKPYSIASSPEQTRRDHAIELLVQVGEDGSAGAHLGEPTAGQFVEIEGPFGQFSFPSNPAERDLLLVAGGTGIAPLRAVLWHALEALPDCRVALLYSVRDPGEFAYRDELRDLARRGRIVLRETVTGSPGDSWTGDHGRLTRDRIAAVLASPATLCLACGPPALVTDVTEWFRQLGIAPERVLSEGW